MARGVLAPYDSHALCKYQHLCKAGSSVQYAVHGRTRHDLILLTAQTSTLELVIWHLAEPTSGGGVSASKARVVLFRV